MKPMSSSAKPILVAVLCCVLVVQLGCGGSKTEEPEVNNNSKSSKEADDAKPTIKKVNSKKASDKSSKIVKKSFSSASSDGTFSAAKSFASNSQVNLTKAIWDYGLESQLSNPTVIVWLFDVTKSATDLRAKVISEIKSEINSNKKPDDDKMFESLVVTYSNGPISIISETATKDPTELTKHLTAIETTSTEGEKTFAALNESIVQFGPLRRIDRKSLILVLVTDETGDDANEKSDGEKSDSTKSLLDEGIENLKKFAIPLFVIGNPSPFGRTIDASDASNRDLTYGPETVYSERIKMGTWDGSTEFNRFDSGFGPWALERLCRASGGRFLANRPAARSVRLVSKMQSNWPTVMSRQFKDSVMSRYKPFYGSADDYLSDLQTNKAKRALHQAAKMPQTQVYRIQNYEFATGNEAQLVRQINSAQRTPAVIRPGLEKLYEILKEGESERDAITSKRWQVSFDLAYGRVLANYVRVIVLNTMLAELKGGKNFTNPENNRWVLEPSDEVSTGSGDRKLGEKAKKILDRVIAEHPDTPWAKIAEKEIERPLGWKWTEAKR